MFSAVPDFQNWFPVVEGFPRPDWKTSGEWIRVNVAPDRLETAWQEVARVWLEKTCEQLGGTYNIGESEYFYLLSELDEQGRLDSLRFLEMARGRILRTLGDIVLPKGPGRHVVLRFTGGEDYYRYIAYYDPDGDYAGSSGRFINNSGYLHIAYPNYDNPRGDRAVLAHELTHNLLCGLPLPLWLNEGLAMLFEQDLSGQAQPALTRSLAEEHKAYWNAETIQEFWRGSSFSKPDGQEMAYSLARILLDFIRIDLQPAPADFREFVLQANRKDAGEAAARNCLGAELSDLVAAFLGPGEWAPRLS